MSTQILLIEDDSIFTFLLQKAIQKSNFEGNLITFNNGLSAIEHLQKEYRKDSNYVLFLDLNMPVMNGWQFMEAFNSIAEPSNCMVFIMTSSRNQLDIDALMENPLIADFIIKPITDILINGIKEKVIAKFKE